jgi:hypothetical protein
MEATNWIALYAAIVATIALTWQAWVRWSEGRPRLSINLALFLFVTSIEDAATLANLATNGATQVSGLQWRADISVTNTGHRPVQVTEVKLRQGPERTGMRAWTANRWGLPWKIESGEQQRCFLTDDDAPELDLRSPLHAHVTIGSGQVYESPQLQVRSATKPNPDANSRGNRVFTVTHPDLAAQVAEQALGPEWRNHFYVYEIFEND